MIMMLYKDPCNKDLSFIIYLTYVSLSCHLTYISLSYLTYISLYYLIYTCPSLIPHIYFGITFLTSLVLL